MHNNIEYNKKDNIFWQDGSKIYKYGYFYHEDIVSCMKTFLTYVEGERFVSCESTEALLNSIIAKASVVSEGEDISKDRLDSMYANGDAIILGSGYSSAVELYDKKGNPNFKVGNYGYLSVFFKSLALYRKENKLNWQSMFPEKIYEFMTRFLTNIPSIAQKNKIKREAMIAQNDRDTIDSCIKLNLTKDE